MRSIAWMKMHGAGDYHLGRTIVYCCHSSSMLQRCDQACRKCDIAHHDEGWWDNSEWCDHVRHNGCILRDQMVYGCCYLGREMTNDRDS